MSNGKAVKTTAKNSEGNMNSKAEAKAVQTKAKKVKAAQVEAEQIKVEQIKTEKSEAVQTDVGQAKDKQPKSKGTPETLSPKSLKLKPEQLVPFDNHPYKVTDDDSMDELVESIRVNGILNPLIVRPIEGVENSYEIISGHRRYHAAQRLGLKKVPCTVHFVDRDTATVMMVDSNCQRTELLPSEKAWAYKMKVEALSHQGRASGPMVPKSDDARTTAEVGIQYGDSYKTVQRYIRLTNLVPELLQFVDDGKIGMRPAVGVYMYKGKETPGGMPRIIDDDLFDKVQERLEKNRRAPARTTGNGEYLLTTKLFCGHCKEMMIGYSGTSKTGNKYHYYNCKNARKKKCDKKIISKQYIEDCVVAECLKMLTEDNMHFIAKKVSESCSKNPDNLTIRQLKKEIREAESAIENLWRGIESGKGVDKLMDRIDQRQQELDDLKAQLTIEENKKVFMTEPQVYAFLDYVTERAFEDVNKKRAIINIFVHSVYLYDDHFNIIFNTSKKPLSKENIPFEDIRAALNAENKPVCECSSLQTSAPPLNLARGIPSRYTSG